MKACNCSSDWRLELLDLSTGERIGWLPFTSFTFEELLNEPGTATVTVPVRKVTMPQVMPHMRAVAFTRTAGPGASKTAPVCEFIGMIETAQAQSGGTLNLGLRSIEAYLAYRIIQTTGDRVGNQTTLLANIVNEFSTDGVQLVGVDGGSATPRTINVEADSDTTGLTYMTDLTNLENGPDYLLRHTHVGDAWVTDVIAQDYVGDTTPRPLNARRGLIAYGLNVDAVNHANWLRGRASDQLATTADNLTDTPYPRFDTSVAFSEIATSGALLTAATNGAQENRKDPIAVPDVTIARLDITAKFAMGDSITLKMDQGAARYEGAARLVGKAWSVSAGSPTLCTFSVTPLDDVRTAVLNLPQSTGQGCC